MQHQELRGIRIWWRWRRLLKRLRVAAGFLGNVGILDQLGGGLLQSQFSVNIFHNIIFRGAVHKCDGTHTSSMGGGVEISSFDDSLQIQIHLEFPGKNLVIIKCSDSSLKCKNIKLASWAERLFPNERNVRLPWVVWKIMMTFFSTNPPSTVCRSLNHWWCELSPLDPSPGEGKVFSLVWGLQVGQ